MTDDFSPVESLQLALRGWWLVLLAMLLGGVGGALIHAARPAQYESAVTFTFALDYARLGSMKDSEEDQIMGTAGAILKNTAMVEQLTARAQAAAWLPAGYDLRENLALERKSYRWILRVRHPDAPTAQRIAALWGDLGAAALSSATQGAENAARLRRELASLESCLQRMAMTEPVMAQCAWTNLPEVQRQAGELGQRLREESATARGMAVGLSFNLTDQAQISSRPAAFGRNTLVLAGGLAGFVVGLALAASGKAHVG